MNSLKLKRRVGGCPEESPAENLVILARSLRPDYGVLDNPIPAPELPEGKGEHGRDGRRARAISSWGLDASRFGSTQWNPLGTFIPPDPKLCLNQIGSFIGTSRDPGWIVW